MMKCVSNMVVELFGCETVVVGGESPRVWSESPRVAAMMSLLM